ncbi:hypothetical protein HW555_003054 [Spodoptera exigua]|uniref:FAD-binding domain-containing protein n=1 Tax=Spodoptera exigua TaxID=7107 RepID=A0A835GNP6_SPOEX|nr:hypothetical protein HW555_003054 [Spodoptera exigua]
MAVQNGYSNKKQLDVIVVGAGLVGSLEALYLAKRGHRVRLYEFREDIRKTPQARGRSINLALSVRGRRALKDVGLETHMIKEHGIPMSGRRIHRTDGSTYVIPYDANTKQNIYSVGRNYLNGLLLQESEQYENVERYFNHKLIESNLKKGSLTFLKTDTNETVNVTADLIIGADGAFSAVRKAMMKQPFFDFSQKYIEHGYLELCIPPADNGGFLMPANYLHIWPRGEFMMIALPNQDCSWTVTLFMPFTKFKNLDTEEKLLAFFEKYFPDSIPLIGKKKLVEDFFAVSPSPLVAVKCRPYHVEDKALIIGDAAHAVMRDLVTRPSYKLRKAMDDFIFWLLPNFWVPLYNSVTFSTMPYSRCIKNREWQDRVLKKFLSIVGIGALIGGAVAFKIKYYS